jgi:hypothetical protein
MSYSISLKRAPLKWEKRYSNQFIGLKRALLMVPILVMIDLIKEYILQTDALDTASRAVLA